MREFGAVGRSRAIASQSTQSLSPAGVSIFPKAAAKSISFQRLDGSVRPRLRAKALRRRADRDPSRRSGGHEIAGSNAMLAVTASMIAPTVRTPTRRASQG
jgi:hypothetical protein